MMVCLMPSNALHCSSFQFFLLLVRGCCRKGGQKQLLRNKQIIQLVLHSESVETLASLGFD